MKKLIFVLCLCLCLCLGGCVAGPVDSVNDFDHALAEYAKAEYHRGDDFTRVTGLLEAYCAHIGPDSESVACKFLESTR